MGLFGTKFSEVSDATSQSRMGKLVLVVALDTWVYNSFSSLSY